MSDRPLRDVSSDALAVLVAANDPPALFVRGGFLIRVRRDEHDRPFIESISEAMLRGRLARIATFVRITPSGRTVHTAPPVNIVNDLLSLGTWPGIPPLVGITEAPTIRPDGTVLSDRGYDPATGLYYTPAFGLTVPPIPECPTRRDLDWAAGVIDDALKDFAFVDSASRANAIAALFTSLIRPAILGQTPLFVIDAPSKGSGKSALVELVDTVVTGGHSGALPETEDDEELRKRYTTLLREGVPLAVMDDVRRRLGSTVFSMMVTVPRWRDRLLGTNVSAIFENRIVLFVLGNNVMLGGDIGRRVAWVRLDTRLARPWRRDNFMRSDLPAWAREHRGSIIAAVLTLARSWWAAGCPEVRVPAFAGFGPWARVLGGILEIAGVEGFLGNLDTVTDQADEGAAEFERFLRAWMAVFGSDPVRAAQIADECRREGSVLRDALPDFLAPFADDRSAGKLAHRLGNLLRRKVDVRHGQDCLRLERAGTDAHSKTGAWRVVSDLIDSAPQTTGESADEPADDLWPCDPPRTRTPISAEALPGILDRLAGGG